MMLTVGTLFETGARDSIPLPRSRFPSASYLLGKYVGVHSRSRNAS